MAGTKIQQTNLEGNKPKHSLVCGTPDFADVTQQSGIFDCKISWSENKSEECAKLSEFISKFIPNYLLGIFGSISKFKMSTFKATNGVTEKLSPCHQEVKIGCAEWDGGHVCGTGVMVLFL